MVRALHDQTRHGRRCLDVLERSDGARIVGLSVHDGRVELDDALLVRKPAVSDARALRVQLDDVGAALHGVQRRASAVQDLPALPHGLLTGLVGVARDDERDAGGKSASRARDAFGQTAECQRARTYSHAVADEIPPVDGSSLAAHRLPPCRDERSCSGSVADTRAWNDDAASRRSLKRRAPRAQVVGVARRMRADHVPGGPLCRPIEEIFCDLLR